MVSSTLHTGGAEGGRGVPVTIKLQRFRGEAANGANDRNQQTRANGLVVVKNVPRYTSYIYSVGRCTLTKPETRVESAWSQRLKQTYDAWLSSYAVKFSSS